MSRDNPRKLSDILNGQSREELARLFDETEAAPDFAPVPTGNYEVDLVHGELYKSQKGTAGYTLHLVVADGEFKGRKIWQTLWLSALAIPYSKRDLKKFGIHSLSECEQPVPRGIYCTISVVVHTEDDGSTRNNVTKIEEGGIRQDPTGDPDFGSPRTGLDTTGGHSGCDSTHWSR